MRRLSADLFWNESSLAAVDGSDFNAFSELQSGAPCASRADEDARKTNADRAIEDERDKNRSIPAPAKEPRKGIDGTNLATRRPCQVAELLAKNQLDAACGARIIKSD